MGTDRRVGTRARTTASAAAVDPSKWPTVDDAALPDDRRRQFLARNRALLLYLGGATAAQLLQDCGMSRTNVYCIASGNSLAQREGGTLTARRGALAFIDLAALRSIASLLVEKQHQI